MTAARCALVTALAVALGAAPAAALEPWRPHVRSAAHYAATRAGGVSFGVRTDAGLGGVGVERAAPSASVLKAMRWSQRWGIARVRPPGWALYFKGGWGSGTGWVDHQVALVRRGRRRLSVAILVTSSPSHEYGKETLRGVAARLLRGLRPSSIPR